MHLVASAVLGSIERLIGFPQHRFDRTAAVVVTKANGDCAQHALALYRQRLRPDGKPYFLGRLARRPQGHIRQISDELHLIEVYRDRTVQATGGANCDHLLQYHQFHGQ